MNKLFNSILNSNLSQCIQLNENITLSMRNEALIFCFLSLSDEETETRRKQCGSEFQCDSSSLL